MWGMKNIFIQQINQSKSVKAFITTSEYEISEIIIAKAVQSNYKKDIIQLFTSSGIIISINETQIPKQENYKQWISYKIGNMQLLIA